ncbi:MAG TPA: hypothetical protein VME43_17790 [Bryobacteraceae bacterium]|nr:hypothetical protein [Bryobacteraceae bacterium]
MIPFIEAGARVEALIVRRYGIPVITGAVGGSFVGDLDGAEIRIDPAAGAEQRLFLLGHLFGHTVQWNTDDDAFALGQPQTPPVSESLLPALLDYEREAASYGLALLAEAGAGPVEPWYSDFSACDLAYLMHYYRTGEKGDFRSFWRNGSPPLRAKPIPPFRPLRRVFRAGGVVI